MGLLDLLRDPRPPAFFIKRGRLKADDSDLDMLVQLMNAGRAASPVPRWSVACSAWGNEISIPHWWLTNGDEWLRVKNEGLWQDMLHRIVRAGLPMARIVAPRSSTNPDMAMFGDVALLHDANIGRLMAYPSAQLRGWVRQHMRDRIRH